MLCFPTVEKRQSVRFTSRESLLCFLISLGYMAPFTFLGGLISYFKEQKNANYYVWLYSAYYFAGLPISLLQQRYQDQWVEKLGPLFMYLFVGQLCLFMQFCVVYVMRSFLLNFDPMILAMFLMGCTSWSVHGAASQLASMIAPGAINALQTGFRCPEIFALICVLALGIGATATPYQLAAYFDTILVLVRYLRARETKG